MTWVPNWPRIGVVIFTLAAWTLIVLAGGGLVVNAWNAHKAAKSLVAVAQAETVIAEGGAAAAADAVGAIDAGRQRDDRTIIIQRENTHDLQTAPGADAPLDDELVRRLARGMCRYASTAVDPGCDELRTADPQVVP